MWTNPHEHELKGIYIITKTNYERQNEHVSKKVLLEIK